MGLHHPLAIAENPLQGSCRNFSKKIAADFFFDKSESE